MSTTWAACSALARCGRSSAIARRHLGDAAGPRRPAVARPNEVDRLVVLAIGADLDGGVEVLEAAERQRRVVAVELEAAGRASPGARHRSSRVSRTTAPPSSSIAATIRSGLPIRNGVPSTVTRSGFRLPAPRPDRAGRPEHRRDERERVDADVDQDADVEERAPAPGATSRSGPSSPRHRRPARSRGGRVWIKRRGRLLRLAEERRRRAAETKPPGSAASSTSSRASLGTQGERLLAVDVPAGLEGPLRDLVMGVVDGQVDDDVDRRGRRGGRRARRGRGSRAPRRRRPLARDPGPSPRRAGSRGGSRASCA